LTAYCKHRLKGKGYIGKTTALKRKDAFMKHRFILGIMVLLLLYSFSGCGKKTADSTSPAPQESKAPVSAYNDILTASDIEVIAGIKGLEIKAEGSKLSFIGSDDAIIYEVRFYNKE
jgi:predicted small lipoprotein YifL